MNSDCNGSDGSRSSRCLPLDSRVPNTASALATLRARRMSVLPLLPSRCRRIPKRAASRPVWVAISIGSSRGKKPLPACSVVSSTRRAQAAARLQADAIGEWNMVRMYSTCVAFVCACATSSSVHSSANSESAMNECSSSFSVGTSACNALLLRRSATRLMPRRCRSDTYVASLRMSAGNCSTSEYESGGGAYLVLALPSAGLDVCAVFTINRAALVRSQSGTRCRMAMLSRRNVERMSCTASLSGDDSRTMMLCVSTSSASMVSTSGDG